MIIWRVGPTYVCTVIYKYIYIIVDIKIRFYKKYIICYTYNIIIFLEYCALLYIRLSMYEASSETKLVWPKLNNNWLYGPLRAPIKLE